MSGANHALRRLNDSVNSFHERVSSPISSVYQSSVNVNNAATQIYEGIEKFRADMMAGEETQLAHENIIRIEQILKEQFSNHEAIRKTVMGVVRDFDINLVRNSTIQELSEEMWLSSSRYWLSYALIAITAWVNDYPEVARNAMSESGRRDAIKTTLFFCLMNLRFERMDAAKKWFCEYIRILDPKMLQQETSVLLQAFLNGIFGRDKELESEVLDLINAWMQELNSDAEACNALVESYVVYIQNLRAPAQFSYESIAQFCVNHEQVRSSFEDVSKFDALVAMVRALDVEATEQNDDNYKTRVDAVLMNLISRYDTEELSLKNQQAYYQFIVDNQGDLGKAEAQYEQLQDLQSASFNIGKQMMRWALFDDDETTDAQVRSFGFHNTKEWFIEALGRWDITLQKNKPVNYELAIDTWSGVSNGSDHAEMADNMRKHFETNKFHNMFINTPNIALALLLILSAGLAFVSLYSLAVTAVALVALVFRVLQAIKAYPLRVEQALTNLDTTMAEIAEYRQFFDEKRGQKDALIGMANFI